RNKSSIGCDCRRPDGRVVVGEEPGSNRDCELVTDMQAGKQLLLELVSIPFQLGITRVCVIVKKGELPGDQAQLQRDTRRRSWRGYSFFAFFSFSRYR